MMHISKVNRVLILIQNKYLIYWLHASCSLFALYNLMQFLFYMFNEKPGITVHLFDWDDGSGSGTTPMVW